MSESRALDGDAEFSLRPLRIQTRTEKDEKGKKGDKASKSDKSAGLKHPPTSSGEFVCRPMRFSLLNSPNTKASDFKDVGLVNADKSPLSSHNSVLETPKLSSSRRELIQIKNLPFVPSPKKATALESLRFLLLLQMVDDTIFAVCLVDFHHVRGPEIQWWQSNYHNMAGSADNDINNRSLFRNLPFQALPDGSHLFEETFSNFNLVYDFAARRSLDDLEDIESFQGNPNHLETLFGCSCVRQVKREDLSEAELARNKEITRSMVQKAVVVISRRQPVFTKIKEKLSIITHSFFQQDSFGNLEVLQSLFDNLNDVFRTRDPAENELLLHPNCANRPENGLNPENYEEHEEYFVNLNLRELLLQFKNDILVILKALLLERKVLIYSNNNLELLTQFQNNMIALIPNLINHLELSGCPLCDYSEKHSPLQKPTSFKSNERLLMLRFFGLPLQVFNTKGSFWNPYLPLQQMDELRAASCMVGCSNLLIVNQLERFGVDVVVDLDARLVTFPSGKKEDLRLTTMDKKFVGVLLASASASKEAYVGSDDYIRYQFEDYIRSLLATVRFQQYLDRFKVPPPGFDTHTDRNLGNLRAFNAEFVAHWQLTKNYNIWNATCDEFIFNFHTPAHLATEMSEPGAAYNFGGFLSSFKKSPAQQQASQLADRANQYFSNAQQPRKYIYSEEPKGKEESHDSDSTDTDVGKSTWAWGFKM